MPEAETGPQPEWETQAKEKLVATLQRNPKARPSELQGTAGEFVVRLQLDDESRVMPLLNEWRGAQLTGGRIKEGIAANNPDWLILDEEGRITAIVEVKAVKSDTQQIEAQKADYIKAWPSYLQPLDLQTWEERLNFIWQSMRNKILHQLNEHLERLSALTTNQVLPKSDNLEAILYVPAQEDYGGWPEQITARDAQRNPFETPLEIRLLPPLTKIQETIRAAQQEALPPAEQAAVAETKPTKKPAEEVIERSGQMENLYQLWSEVLNTSSMEELNQKIAWLLLGENPVRSEREGLEPLNPNDHERLLRRLGSAAPTLTAHFLFLAAGSKLPGISKAEKTTWEGFLKRRGSENDERLAAFFGALIKSRNHLINQGWNLPTLEDIFNSFSGPSQLPLK